MADSYTQGTMSPDIPLTEEQVEALEDLNGGDEPSHPLAVKWCEGLEIDCEYGEINFEPADKTRYYFYAEYGLEEWAIHVLQEILKGLPEDEYPHLIWEGSYSCSKMRPGEFGGWAVIIYRDRVESYSTAQWISEETESQKA